ncbi:MULTISPECIES: L-glutamate gamma-semialdehyde dehydrogenase [Brevibacillus]|uniref:L-glutamate gamma-semialdehyde dehydrogenase n=1 Tax=Brevibacillus laterosporus LMG 15441 TaxID=1042163 RepID=A0A075R0A8_BRELA|nr:L-glutamate gamma-semialdehyde dehydrogenase [Brevibacillus laterosporus]MCZ0836064.1 L-glutamate gamma-semialdehyde dehydrogenase [Brevibacillus halotolerans]AIG24871.1 1-pyrroline-5-carboxylate dehydrogenase 1 [Brevibacillus laterosporus LMG 15441]AUM63513.1 L-glutamate gamma-semialdehyde dehydrogenase [Brevibacillus laterosporus]AYK06520.1 L-glutamate gamma-semialdehyde dehydrogenase [Brevibacillus laterosporus]MCR8963909.1 L-glutamate gamma-semialdehyde dehydrogenase [Brevibacillus late
MQVEFKNEPFVNFNLPENKQAFQAALDIVESELGREYDLIIGGERIKTEKKSRSMNPSQKDECIGVVSQADQELAEKAIQVAAKTFETWKRVAPTARSRYLYKAAAILRRRKHEFSAWLVKESGKSWPEADADTAEAIDFMEYYARQMDQLGQRHSLPRIPGEDNELYYIPLGVGIVIPPWNFPLAIMVGMTTAALVTGNTVVLKPASTTPVIAAKFMEILDEAGVPAGVVNFVPGSGSEIGDYLVEHTLTRFISFTGSRDVGLRINELAAKHRPGQKWMKRLVAEMGGKDSIIVDNDADLELAAQAITASAFGFSGQKCSACSRAIIHADVYDEVLARVVEHTKALTVGNVSNPEFYTGPVVDEKAYNKILEYIEIGKQEGKLMAGGEKGPEEGYYIMPTVFADVAPDARIMQEEIFGPFVAFCKANDFDHALKIANNTEYGLTGSVISRNRAHLERAREEFHVGNLYFNRKCTGALVGVHPFGGFNMSGTDSKAGGPDYLLLFTQAKLVSELL